MGTEELLSRIDDSKRCSACEQEDRYCATYVGPTYHEAIHRILFIGLDPGGGDSRSYDLQQRQAGILEWYASNNWNQHYRGCVKVASHFLSSDCSTRCASKCTPDSGKGCVLRSFAQGNAVKCVPASATDMTFRNHKRIRPCLPLMLEEITALRPDLIVLQGRALGAGDPYSEPFFKITGDNHGTIGRLYFANWPDGWRSIIVSFSHPSRGHLDRHWETEIVPALNEARRLLEDAR